MVGMVCGCQLIHSAWHSHLQCNYSRNEQRTYTSRPAESELLDTIINDTMASLKTCGANNKVQSKTSAVQVLFCRAKGVTLSTEQCIFSFILIKKMLHRILMRDLQPDPCICSTIKIKKIHPEIRVRTVRLTICEGIPISCPLRCHFRGGLVACKFKGHKTTSIIIALLIYTLSPFHLFYG